MPLFVLAHSADAQDISSKDKLLTVSVPALGEGFTTASLNINLCLGKKKCKVVTYRLLLTELNSKGKTVSKKYFNPQTEPDSMYLEDLKPEVKYTASLEQKSGKKWSAVANSKVTFKIPKEALVWLVPVTQQPPPIQPTQPQIAGTTTPVSQVPVNPTVNLPFMPIQFSASTLDIPILQKNKINQQVYRARFVTPQNREVTATGFVIRSPKELLLQNMRLYLGQNLFAQGTHIGDGLYQFSGTLRLPASQPVDLLVYADIPAGVPSGTGKSVLAGMATSYSGSNYEVLDFKGVEPSSPFEIPPDPVASQTQNTNTGAVQNLDLGGGLQLQFFRLGTGTVVSGGRQVAVHYVGTLENAIKFDSSIDRGQPFVFTVGAGQVIQGWDRALEGRRVGDQFRVFIPSNLGYGASSAGSIPPNSNLIFDIAVLDTK